MSSSAMHVAKTGLNAQQTRDASYRKQPFKRKYCWV